MVLNVKFKFIYLNDIHMSFISKITDYLALVRDFFQTYLLRVHIQYNLFPAL